MPVLAGWPPELTPRAVLAQTIPAAAALANVPVADADISTLRYGRTGAAPWGDFAKLHKMDQLLSTAHRYNAVVAAADGTLWAATSV